jgi:hypothetical protein
MRVVERQFSEFLRQPNEVVAELDEHDVLLRRRGAPALRLTQADRDDVRTEAVEAVVRMLRNLAVHDHPSFAAALEDGFPWAVFLPKGDRKQFAMELTQALVASVNLQNFAPVAQLLREWRATAEIHADPELAARLRKRLSANGGRVAIPKR